jgi:hypothetical protein
MLRNESLFVSDDTQQDVALMKFLRKHIRDYFFRKLSDYEAECELRIVALPGATIGRLKSGNPNAYVRYARALAAIVLGHDFPESYYAAAMAAAGGARVPLYSIQWFDGRPRLFRQVVPPSIKALVESPEG